MFNKILPLKCNAIEMSVTMIYLRNEFNFWNVHGIMNTSGLLQSKLTLQETQSIHDSMKRSKIEFIAYIYILL